MRNRRSSSGGSGGASMARWTAAAAALLLAALAPRAAAFYLPGVAPQDFKKGDVIYPKVNKLSSTRTQLPYEYYSLPYCRPAKIVPFAENLGEVLRGDRIENSLYQLAARSDEQCRVLCRIESLTRAQAKAFRDKVDDDYKVNMILDNLPVAMVKVRRRDTGIQEKAYERGFYVGFKATLDGQKVRAARACVCACVCVCACKGVGVTCWPWRCSAALLLRLC
jgi:transmembrane 9 superfamily protein 2/4